MWRFDHEIISIGPQPLTPATEYVCLLWLHLGQRLHLEILHTRYAIFPEFGSESLILRPLLVIKI